MIPRWALRIGAVTTVLIPQLLGGATSEVREPNDRWSDRLEALEPERPLAYLELAEEIVDAEADEELLALAAHLYALAGVLDTPRLGRSACLGLADLSRQEHVKRRLRALARLLADDEVVPAEETLTSSERPSAVALAAVSQAFSLYRRGQGSRARIAAPAGGDGASPVAGSVAHRWRQSFPRRLPALPHRGSAAAALAGRDQRHAPTRAGVACRRRSIVVERPARGGWDAAGRDRPAPACRDPGRRPHSAPIPVGSVGEVMKCAPRRTRCSGELRGSSRPSPRVSPAALPRVSPPPLPRVSPPPLPRVSPPPLPSAAASAQPDAEGPPAGSWPGLTRCPTGRRTVPGRARGRRGRRASSA